MKTILFSILLTISNFAFAAQYKIDNSHTELGFSVRHLLISNVKGRFNEYSGTFEYDKEKNTFKNLSVEINPNSIDTAQKNRDKHLKSDDFFDTEKYKIIKLTSTKVEFSKDGKSLKVYADLKIKDQTKPVVLDVTIEGEAEIEGEKRIAFIAKTEINRKEWGINWNKNLDNGGVAVSNEVKIVIEGQAKLVQSK